MAHAVRVRLQQSVKKHGVSFADAEALFEDPLAVHRTDPDAEGEERFVAIGLGAAGEVLVVVYVLRGAANPVDRGTPRDEARSESVCELSTIFQRGRGRL